VISNIYGAAARGLVTELARHEVIANNVANAHTAGFLRDAVVVNAAPPATAGGASGAAALPWPEVAGTIVETQPGGLRRTDNPLDLAVSGDGYFVVETTEGRRLTRDGSFTLDSEGSLLTHAGQQVQGDGGAIQTTARTIEVTAQGELIGDGAPLDRLQLLRPRTGAVLVKTAEGLLAPLDGDAALEPAEDVQVLQGYQEDSSVNAVREMVDMIGAFRAYEAGVRSIQALDSAVGTAIDRVGRLV
jgi:flagellar basal-body rod protein FlgG